MSFDFPSSPTNGQQFTPPGGPTYVWQNPRWLLTGVPSGAMISDTAPATPVIGQTWWESDTGQLFVYYSDGNSNQWVQVSGSSIPDAPADGNEYVRVNGVWRLSKQNFDLAGLTTQDISVPAWGPIQVRLSVFIYVGSPSTLSIRVSQDGTTFPSGATDYSTAGFWHRSDNGALTNATNTNGNLWSIAGVSDHPAIPQQADTMITLVRSTTGQAFGFRTRGSGYNLAGGMQFQTYYYNGYTPGATWTALALKAIRLMSSVAPGVGSRLTVEWLP